MKRYLRCETLNNKTYLFRGQSNNSYQSNYSKKHKTRFASRFYAYELYDGIQLFGNIAVYELLPTSHIFDYDDSVEQFIEDYELENLSVPELKQIYKIDSLSELAVYGGDIEFNNHDLYHARQLVAIAYCEDNLTNYDGIAWYEWDDTPENQLMIWNNGKAVRRLAYQEAKSALRELEEVVSQLGIKDSLYTKDPFDGKYNYAIARR